ncbi:glycerophosphodiester phosphodiesterase family protein [Microvirga thermotolerans]|uniref:Glycerophosphodiester phosphodiesterase n=1 Tax=Microvirga thermotolerans TaxID=2651334 RepID=A0A5P9K021_9HYPH|nr:glycerophosphodiester phosphodiesterase family protein [Microvirga thermotolerans]QFU16990.1 glycerophosphodiester phosphodiesterase [Microvirga thermotolerans]
MVMIVGHRGARNLWPENSLEGFRKLAAMGVEGVEFDVHMTRDGKLVVIHDPTLERTTHGSGPVGRKTLAELQSIGLRDSSERIPSLDEVLDVLGPSGLELHIEIKTDAVGNPYEGLEALALEAVRRRGLEERSFLTCFAPEVLERVRQLDPKIRVLASLDRRSAEMMGGLDRAIARFAAIPGCTIAVEKALLVHSMESFLSAVGTGRLGAWVPNEEADLEYWLAQPVRQITTDRPDLALAVRRRLAEAAA